MGILGSFYFLGSVVTRLGRNQTVPLDGCGAQQALAGEAAGRKPVGRVPGPSTSQGEQASLIPGMISLWTELFRKRQFQRFPLLSSPGILFIIYMCISSKWVPCFDGASWPNYTKNSFFYLVNKHLSLESPSSEIQFLSANIDSPTSWQCSFGQSTSPL